MSEKRGQNYYEESEIKQGDKEINSSHSVEADLGKWGGIAEEKAEEDYLKGTSDNPKTGKYEDFVKMEDIPAPEKEDEQSEVALDSENLSDAGNTDEDNKDEETGAVWLGKKPVKGQTMSSDQDLSEHDFINEKKVPEPRVIKKTGEIEKVSKSFLGKGDGVIKDRSRQPQNKGKRGLLKETVHKLFGRGKKR